LIQALAIFAFWKDAGDTGGWRKVGYGESCSLGLTFAFWTESWLIDGCLIT
jgi:hypothetical protein